MTEISFEYNKKRREFCLPFQLSDSAAQILHSIDPVKKEQSNWSERFATTVEVDCIAEVAEVKVDMTKMLYSCAILSVGGYKSNRNAEQWDVAH